MDGNARRYDNVREMISAVMTSLLTVA